MDLQSITEPTKKTFFNHVFSGTDEGKAEILNVLQYVVLAIIPVVLLNKSIQRFVPEADSEKSSLEILAEIFIQLLIMFCGIILIHRIIVYIPTYSGFKYEALNLTNVILAFLIVVLSIQTKLGIKVNIIVDRINELWNGPQGKQNQKKQNGSASHTPSRADTLDNSDLQTDMFPPAPVATTRQPSTSHDMMYSLTQGPQNSGDMGSYMGPMAANGVLGGAFGAAF
jgi:hypothetical protein